MNKDKRTRLEWFLIAHPSKVVEAYCEDGSLHEAIAQEIEQLRRDHAALNLYLANRLWSEGFARFIASPEGKAATDRLIKESTVDVEAYVKERLAQS